MSDIQQFLTLMADALHNGALGEEGCADLCKALNGVPAEYHAAALKAFLGGEDEAQDAPEDYAVVKTFDSSEFHVGDEVIVDGFPCVIYQLTDLGTAYVFGESSVISFVVGSKAATRTGRNFPAIAAILEKIRK